jgi:hypothetical protein
MAPSFAIRWRQDEGIEVWLPHRPIEVVKCIAQRNPSTDQLSDVTGAIRIEIHLCVEVGAFRQRGMDIDAERGRHLQRVDNVKVVRPGFGEIFPRM